MEIPPGSSNPSIEEVVRRADGRRAARGAPPARGGAEGRRRRATGRAGRSDRGSALTVRLICAECRGLSESEYSAASASSRGGAGSNRSGLARTTSSSPRYASRTPAASASGGRSEPRRSRGKPGPRTCRRSRRRTGSDREVDGLVREALDGDQLVEGVVVDAEAARDPHRAAGHAAWGGRTVSVLVSSTEAWSASSDTSA